MGWVGSEGGKERLQAEKMRQQRKRKEKETDTAQRLVWGDILAKVSPANGRRDKWREIVLE
jgi:hypothetical protein